MSLATSTKPGIVRRLALPKDPFAQIVIALALVLYARAMAKRGVLA